MSKRQRVIVVTDGDVVAQQAVAYTSAVLGLRLIAASGGNPTPLSGAELIDLIKEVPYDPVVVMVDDRGAAGQGAGECALAYIAEHPDIDVLGVIAVASNTEYSDGIRPDVSITKTGEVLPTAVDKDGELALDSDHTDILYGDTVDVLTDLDIPVVIGIGDIGKMDTADALTRGCPVTRRALEEILKRSGISYE